MTTCTTVRDAPLPSALSRIGASEQKLERAGAEALQGLDPEQRAAASAEASRLVILAAAGSGKTRTTIARVTWRMARGTAPSAMLLTTFTRKAAEEMEERLQARAGDEARALPVGTLHAHCLRWLPELLPELPAITITRTAPAEEALSPETRRTARHTSGHFSLDELEEEVALLLEEGAARTRAWAEPLQEILVDEAQDLSERQASMLLRLAELADADLTLIGDDYQSIYAFRGARPAFLVQCAQSVHWRVCTIGTNYRSVSAVVEAAQSLIEHNESRTEKSARAARGSGADVRWRGMPDPWTETCTILGEVARANREPSDGGPATAVLFRTRALLSSWEHACWVAGMRYLRLGEEPGGLEALPGPHVVLPLLRLIAGVESVEDHRRWDAFRDQEDDPRALTVDQARRAWAAGEPCPAWGLQRVLDGGWTGPSAPSLRQRLIQQCRAQAEDDAEDAVATLQRHLSWLAFTARGEPWLEAWLLSLERWSWREPVLVLGTIHQSKGKEWPCVYLPRWEEGILPWRDALDAPDALEEERRIAYVALTRARDELHVSWTMDTEARPSRFIQEARAHRTRDPIPRTARTFLRPRTLARLATRAGVHTAGWVRTRRAVAPHRPG